MTYFKNKLGVNKYVVRIKIQTKRHDVLAVYARGGFLGTAFELPRQYESVGTNVLADNVNNGDRLDILAAGRNVCRQGCKQRKGLGDSQLFCGDTAFGDFLYEQPHIDIHILDACDVRLYAHMGAYFVDSDDKQHARSIPLH